MGSDPRPISVVRKPDVRNPEPVREDLIEVGLHLRIGARPDNSFEWTTD